MLFHSQGLQRYAACQSHAFMKGTGTFLLGEQRFIRHIPKLQFQGITNCRNLNDVITVIE